MARGDLEDNEHCLMTLKVSLFSFLSLPFLMDHRRHRQGRYERAGRLLAPLAPSFSEKWPVRFLSLFSLFFSLLAKPCRWC